MKNLKLIIYSTFIALMMASCSNKNDILDDMSQISESETIQTVVSELRTHINSNGDLLFQRNPSNNIIFDFCFDFVYPIDLLYNNGTTVTVNSFEELITVIVTSTPQLFIVGVDFPFDVEVYNPVTNEIEIVTILNEIEFLELLDSCELTNTCQCPNVYNPVCVEIEQNGTIILIQFINSCYAECEGFTPNDFVPCANDCQCSTDYDPVCVETNSGEIFEFYNECYALCEGFTPNDFVVCPVSDCEINDIDIAIGDCNPNGTYSVVLNFEYENVNSDTFAVFLNNEYLADYELTELPITIDDIITSGNGVDELTVCINDTIVSCCATIDWIAPNCGGNDCDITNLNVVVGDCSNNVPGAYSLTVDFEHINAGGDSFDIYIRNNVLLDTYLLSELPLTIEDFEVSGAPNDYLKVCISGQQDCCEELEWTAPNCGGNECDITDLNVIVGDCNQTGSYALTLDFAYENSPSDFFEIYVRNGVLLGNYALADLPITIEEFEFSGFPTDYLSVQFANSPNCVEDIEWTPPSCNTSCDITNLSVSLGDCDQSGIYPITIDFDYVNPGSNFFDVYLENNVPLGTFALTDLPLTLVSIELSNATAGYIRVCINDNPNCCEEAVWANPCDDCQCQQVYDPVCVLAGNGTIITYYNACYAECDGFTPNDFIPCVNDCSSCANSPYDPVCVDVNGITITYYNECFAFCDGFTPNNYVTCD